MSCNTCNIFYKSNTVTVGATEVVITLKNCNGDAPTGYVSPQRLCFVICESLPSGTLTLPVEVVIDGVNVPLWNKQGNVFTYGELKSRKNYKCWYGVQGVDPHLIAVNDPCTLA